MRDACSASSALGDCPAEPGAGHPGTARPSRDCPGHGALSSAPQTRDLMQVNGPRACGAYWHARAARATMAGWLVMTARSCCGGPLCPFWTGQALGDARMGVHCRSRRYPGCHRGRALGLRPPAAGPGGVGRRCWLRAGGVGPWHGSTDGGRGAREPRGPGRDGRRAAKGLFAQACCSGPGYRRDGNTRGPPGIAVLPLVRPCFPGSVDGHWRAVAPAPPAAADGARDRQRSPGRRLQCSAGGAGRAAAQAEDGRRLSPGRSRIGSPAAGSIG